MPHRLPDQEDCDKPNHCVATRPSQILRCMVSRIREKGGSVRLTRSRYIHFSRREAKAFDGLANVYPQLKGHGPKVRECGPLVFVNDTDVMPRRHSGLRPGPDGSPPPVALRSGCSHGYAVAVITAADGNQYVGQALCSRDDRFNGDVGACEALSRAAKKAGISLKGITPSPRGLRRLRATQQ